MVKVSVLLLYRRSTSARSCPSDTLSQWPLPSPLSACRHPTTGLSGSIPAVEEFVALICSSSTSRTRSPTCSLM
ncbi:hypothetical protein BJX70DRAFT_268736 [Aspergillus crustosus]